MELQNLLRVAVVAALSAAETPALAASNTASPVEEQIQALRELVERQQAQLDEQQRQLAAQRTELDQLRTSQTQVVAAPTPADAGPRLDAIERTLEQSKVAAQDNPKVRMNANRATITSADGRSSIAVRANVQLDYGHYDQESAGPPETDFRRGSVGSGSRENDAARDLSDGAYFRRARLGVEGTIARDFNYRFLMELGGAGTEGPTRINDAYVAYTGVAPFTFQVGAFSPPANMADGISTEDLLFLERATPAELSRALGGADGRLGLGMRVGGERWLGALTLTGRTVNDAEVFDSQSAVVGRFGGLVLAEEDYKVHLGINGTYVVDPAQGSRAPGTVQYGIRFRDRPELRVDSTRLIDTGSIDAESAYSTGLEFAAQWRNLLLQGEHFWHGIERRDPTFDDPRFTGAYVEGSWLLTGESRRYSAANGAFQAPKPRIPFDGRGGWGAWELALRYSNTDLNFDEGAPGTEAPLGSVRGGEQEIFAAGINWYLNPNLKLMLNYLHIDVDRLNPAGPENATPFGAPPATPPPGVNVGQTLDVYALRSQFSF
jgi:phosphate-selective porin OprO/OprP